MAQFAQNDELKASFLRLEASWLRLAEAVEKADGAEDPAMPPPEDSADPPSPRPN